MKPSSITSLLVEDSFALLLSDRRRRGFGVVVAVATVDPVN